MLLFAVMSLSQPSGAGSEGRVRDKNLGKSDDIEEHEKYNET